ncbi:MULTISPECIES: hypothetical protein [unclassified Actinopolyspora]|uniref:hypothetical protein n=1 Tax=unclassified Actinopolyspora TaxID=2639451 RepID=UPI0013F65A47|nr:MULTISPECIES: hypothetical protein [unclassified Actinopolyspora]NHD19334.1 hypothetical protein [Actinopolyspora sp. BKK2]NHE78458.1 hypothetical protein [Actinopolyspora sp. BKK1]
MVPGFSASAVAAKNQVYLSSLSGGSTSWAFALNEQGVIVGQSGDAQGRSRPVRWDQNGTVADLGTLAGDTEGTAHAINRDGTIVGESILGTRSRAVRWQPDGTTVALPGLSGSERTRAYSINNEGWVTGFSANQDGLYQPVRWEPSGALVRLPVLPGHVGGATSVINDQGVVAGYSATADNVQRAVLWDARGHVRDLGGVAPGYDSSQASSINDKGSVVGNTFKSSAGLDSPYLAQRWSPDGEVTRLRPLPGFSGSAVFGLSDSGVAVGYSYNPGGESSAVAWTPDGQVVDLGVSGRQSSEAYAVNRAGTVVGQRTPSGEGPQAVRWNIDSLCAGDRT